MIPVEGFSKGMNSLKLHRRACVRERFALALATSGVLSCEWGCSWVSSSHIWNQLSLIIAVSELVTFLVTLKSEMFIWNKRIKLVCDLEHEHCCAFLRFRRLSLNVIQLCKETGCRKLSWLGNVLGRQIFDNSFKNPNFTTWRFHKVSPLPWTYFS